MLLLPGAPPHEFARVTASASLVVLAAVAAAVVAIVMQPKLLREIWRVAGRAPRGASVAPVLAVRPPRATEGYRGRAHCTNLGLYNCRSELLPKQCELTRSKLARLQRLHVCKPSAKTSREGRTRTRLHASVRQSTR